LYSLPNIVSVINQRG